MQGGPKKRKLLEPKAQPNLPREEITIAELFKKQGVTVAYYGAGDHNKGAACFETKDLNAFMGILESPETAEAMSHDGIIDGTVEVFVLDSTLETE